MRFTRAKATNFYLIDAFFIGDTVKFQTVVVRWRARSRMSPALRVRAYNTRWLRIFRRAQLYLCGAIDIFEHRVRRTALCNDGGTLSA